MWKCWFSARSSSTRMDPIMDRIARRKDAVFRGPGGPRLCRGLLPAHDASAPPAHRPMALTDDDDAAIYFSSGTTGFPKAILHNHRASHTAACMTEQHHHGQTRQRRVPVHSAPVPYRRENALVRQPACPAARRCCCGASNPSGFFAPCTEEQCTIVWLLVPWAQDHAGRHRTAAGSKL